jgi:transcription initiation factor TFIIIB Brf1 subunit/transcription initiation factor TFIIB
MILSQKSKKRSLKKWEIYLLEKQQKQRQRSCEKGSLPFVISEYARKQEEMPISQRVITFTASP